jgi:hypothetical protein
MAVPFENAWSSVNKYLTLRDQINANMAHSNRIDVMQMPAVELFYEACQNNNYNFVLWQCTNSRTPEYVLTRGLRIAFYNGNYKIVKYIAKFTGDYSHETFIDGSEVEDLYDDYTLLPTFDENNFFYWAIGPLTAEVEFDNQILRVRRVTNLFVLYIVEDYETLDQSVNFNKIGFLYNGVVHDETGNEIENMADEILNLVLLLFKNGDHLWVSHNLEPEELLQGNDQILEYRYELQHERLLLMQSRVDNLQLH